MIIRRDKTIETIRAKHAKEIRIFQENCPHDDVSEWMPYMWAPGHFGPDVKICNVCEKIIEKKEHNVLLEGIK